MVCLSRSLFLRALTHDKNHCSHNIFRSIQVTHSLTVVFFSRTYLTAQFQKPDKTSGCDLRMFEEAEIPTAAIYRDVDGRLYEVRK